MKFESLRRQPLSHESEATTALRETVVEAIEQVWQLRDARAALAREVIPWWRPRARRQRDRDLDELDRQIKERVDQGLFLNSLYGEAVQVDLIGLKIRRLTEKRSVES
jgi:hypothetical protein